MPGMRPRKATGGRDAPAINSTSEMIAPIITPRSKPCPRTPNMAAIATTNSRRSLRQSCLKVDSLNKPATATNTTAANTGWGNALNRCEKKSTTTKMNSCREGAGQRRARAAPFVDEDCDMPPLIGNPWPNPAARLEAAERQKFLVGVQPSAVLGRERAADGGGLHRGEQEAREGQRQHFVQVVPVNRGQADGRQALAALRRATSPRARPDREGAKPRCRPPRPITP